MNDPVFSAPLSCSRADSLARKFVELSSQSSEMPKLLVCWPSARMNKFQSLLYRRAERHGFAVEWIGSLDELDEIFWPGPVVLHAHWFGPLGKKATTEAEFETNIAEAFDTIGVFKDRCDAKLIWTAHNLLPHGSRFPEIDLRLRCRVLEVFDLVHVMDPDHPELLKKLTGVSPEVTVSAPHPHYYGAYPDHVLRGEAREQIGFEPGTTNLLFFGSIQPYKGLEDLITVFKATIATARPELRLVIAGFPSDREYIAKLGAMTGDDPNIRFVPRKIGDEEIQLFFRAADAVVLPYAGDQLNSGAAVLALSFGCPVIAPNDPAFVRLRDYGVSLYDKDSANGLAERLHQPFEGVSDDAIARFRSDHDPDRVSDIFFGALQRLDD